MDHLRIFPVRCAYLPMRRYLTHSLTLWQPDLSLPRTIGKPLCFDAALVNKLVPCTWLLSGALEVWSLRLRLRLRYRTDTGAISRLISAIFQHCTYHNNYY